jgi:hypothetical protein
LADVAQSQKKVIAATGYMFTPVVPAIVLFSDMKADAFLRRHAAQALLWAPAFVIGVVLVAVVAILLLRTDLLFICLLPLLVLVPFIPGGLWARRVYLDRDVRVRVLTPLAERLFPVA